MINKISNYFTLLKEEQQKENENVVWLIYRLLDEESKRLFLEYKIEEFLPTEFSLLNNSSINFIEKKIIDKYVKI